MNNRDLQEHFYKETLKRIVDNSQNYPDKVKEDVKHIIDLGKSPEEICQGILTYFAALKLF